MPELTTGSAAPTPPARPPALSGGPVPAPPTAELSQANLALRRFRRHRLAVISLVVLLLIVLFAFAGPLFWPYDHTVGRDIPPSSPPSLAHPFGTTTAGHDVMGQVMRGAQQSLKVALTVAVLSTVVGSVWGAVAGLYGGRVDNLMMRIADIVLVIPLLVLVTAMAGNVRGGTTWLPVALIISAFVWPGTARVVRSLVLSLREQEFVEACRAMGASNVRVVFAHLLPNAAGPIIVAATLAVAFAILTEAALSFLGFGIRPPDTSLGLLIENARTAPFTRPWLFYPPGVFIVAIALTINFIGDGLRDALDPRQHRIRR